MKNKFKKILVAAAIVPCMICATACNEDDGNNPSNINPKYNNVSNIELIGGSDIVNYAYGSLQGKIDDIMVYNTSYYDGLSDIAVYSDGVFYDYRKDGTVQWNIGDGYKLIKYNGVTLIAENDSGELFAIQNILNLETNARTLYSKKLTVSKANFRGLIEDEEDAGKLECLYVSEGYLYSQKYDLIANTSESALQVYCNFLTEGSPNGYEITYVGSVERVKDICIIGKTGNTIYDAYVYTESNKMCGVGLRENNAEYVAHATGKALASNTYGSRIQNVEDFICTIHDGASVAVSIPEDDANIYVYAKNAWNPYESEEAWYNEAVKINLPEGYEEDDIECTYSYKDYFVKFTDNSYYLIDDQALKTARYGDEFDMIKFDALTSIDAACEIVDVFYDNDTYIFLMDDGCVYKLKN